MRLFGSFAPVRVLATECNTADCKQAEDLIEGLGAEYLLADRGYDTDAIVDQAQEQEMIAVIPLKRNRKKLREYDKDLYKLRHLVENAFLHLKRWRGVATQYAESAASFVATVKACCLMLRLKIS
jgi:transposase